MGEALGVGATWLPAASGPQCWLDFRPATAARDLATMRAAGFATARVHLAWDAFMPSHRQVSRHRLRDLDSLLGSARDLGMRCELVLFAQTFGDGVLLPRYAVARTRPRPGVRVLTEGSVTEGGPRDQWVDPLMLEVEEMWLSALLESFANHPAVAAWDLGHDPATTVRPRRIAHVAAWCALHGGAIRARGDRVRLTLGAGDVLVARGMRLAAAAAHVDALGLAVDPQRLGLGRPVGEPDLEGAEFVVELAMRLAADGGAAVPLHLVTGLAAGDPADFPRGESAPEPVSPAVPWDVALLDPPAAAAAAGELVGRLAEAGVAALCATAWTTLSDLVARSAPIDRTPALARHGLARPDGELRAAGEQWSALALAEREAAAPAPWPARLDAEQYYRELPDSARDLFADWRADRGGPADEEG
ncbi:MAG TPA: hypothetical protein VFO60_02490 [Candidatus Dormibacteraeota bacterium]|nr:hypothetical protein [Candidatus Dormibacteraeota bacterium]